MNVKKGINLLRVVSDMAGKFKIALVLLAAGALAWSSRPALADTTVFSDNFSSSTLNGVSSPTSTSTSYDIASSKAATSAIGAGDLSITLPSTSSGLVEAQALFAASPITLASSGDYIDFKLTFTDTANILIAGKLTSGLWIGLFNSGGVAPLTSLQSSGLATNFTGGTQGWQGYHNQLTGTGGSVKTYLRAPQTAAAGDQDLLGNNASSGTTYANPRGFQLSGQATSAVTLTNGQQLTAEFKVMLNGTGGTTVSNILFDVASGNTLLGLSSTTNGIPITAFDGLAFGWQYKGAAGDPASTMDVSSLSVTTNVPEPSTIGLVLGGLGLLMGIRRSRKTP